MIRNVGPDICMFSSDYPHAEGGRNPLKRFDDVDGRRSRGGAPRLLRPATSLT